MGTRTTRSSLKPKMCNVLWSQYCQRIGADNLVLFSMTIFGTNAEILSRETHFLRVKLLSFLKMPYSNTDNLKYEKNDESV